MKQFVLFILAASVLAVPMPPVSPSDIPLDGGGHSIDSETRFQENRRLKTGPPFSGSFFSVPKKQADKKSDFLS